MRKPPTWCRIIIYHIGDIYYLAGDDQLEEECEPIGIWGQRHLRYIKQHKQALYSELLTRNKIDMGTVIMDGCYVAHQGKLSGKVTAWMFKKLKNTGKLPSLIMVMMKLLLLNLK